MASKTQGHLSQNYNMTSEKMVAEKRPDHKHLINR